MNKLREYFSKVISESVANMDIPPEILRSDYEIMLVYMRTHNLEDLAQLERNHPGITGVQLNNLMTYLAFIYEE
ncbi:MAG: hypothetical protein QXP38_00750 [Nitrososphaerota archaeon]